MPVRFRVELEWWNNPASVPRTELWGLETRMWMGTEGGRPVWFSHARVHGHAAAERAINKAKQLKISTSNFREPLRNTQPAGGGGGGGGQLIQKWRHTRLLCFPAAHIRPLITLGLLCSFSICTEATARGQQTCSTCTADFSIAANVTRCENAERWATYQEESTGVAYKQHLFTVVALVVWLMPE